MLFLSIACSHHEKTFIQQTYIVGNCSEQIKAIKLPYGQNFIDISKQATAGSVSVAIAGVGAVTDAFVIILTSPVTKITLCVMTISAVLSGHGGNSDICNYLSDPGYNPKLAQKALDKTKSWRCPNLDYISEGLRNVATCYVDQNEKAKAKLQLESILKNKQISQCLSKNETDRIQQEIQKIAKN